MLKSGKLAILLGLCVVMIAALQVIVTSALDTGFWSGKEGVEEALPGNVPPVGIEEAAPQETSGLITSEAMERVLMPTETGVAVSVAPSVGAVEPGESLREYPLYVSRLEQRLDEFRDSENPGYDKAWWLMVSAVVASLEQQGRGVDSYDGMKLHIRDPDHFCLGYYTPESGDRTYCVIRQEFPEFFELKEMGKQNTKVLEPITVTDDLCTRLEGRAGYVLSILR